MLFHSTKAHTRTVALMAVAGVTALGLGACATPAAQEETSSASLSGEIVWADYGGPTNEARQAAYFDSFIAETGVDVISTSQAEAVMFAMLEGGAGEYDAMHVGLSDVYLNKATIPRLDPSIPRDDALPEDIRDYGFGTFIIGHVQAYLPETFPQGGPETWADFWDVETFPGKRAWPGSAGMFGSIVEAALLADGVAPDELYPLDLDRAFAKMSELRDHLVFYTAWPEVQQLLATGTAAVAYGPTGQFTGLRGQGVDVTISWDQAIVNTNLMVIPAKAPNPENIAALASWMAEPERQADFAGRTFYGPGLSKTFDLIPDEVAENIVTAPSHTKVVYADEAFRATVYEDTLNRFAEWLTVT